MKVSHVMTTEVLTASTETPLREVAEVLSRNRISGLPVTDAERRVLGVVSEADFVQRAASGGDGYVGTSRPRAT